jgi:50S ribosomal subunit-associated GTPase HflX
VELEERARAEIGSVPFVFVMNKCDLVDDWEFDPEMKTRLATKSWAILCSSAKTGQGVEEAFSQLARKIVG